MAQKSKKNKITKQELMDKLKKVNQLNLVLTIIIGLLSLFIIGHFIKADHGPKVVKKVNKVLDNNYVFLGDSITAGYDLTKFYVDYPVVNSGIGGYTTDNILERLDKMVYPFNPSKVFLLIGTNDIAQNRSKEHIISNIEKIIDNIKNNRKYTEIYVESIYPINSKKEKMRDNKLIDEINKEIKKICKEKDVKYLNIHDSLMDDSGNLKEEYSNDGLHLTKEGYDVVTSKIKPYLK